MRESTNELSADGLVRDGFDYDVQVWVSGGIVQRCGHPESMGPTCCNGRIYAGKAIAHARQLEGVNA